MARRYSCVIPDTSYTAAMGVQTIIEIAAAADQQLTLIEAHISQTNSETSTMEVMDIVRFATAGTGGTAITEQPLDPGDSASSFVAVEEPTAEGGTPTVVAVESWNILTGYHYVPTPKGRFILEGSDIIAIRIAEALEATYNIVGYVIVAEGIDLE